MTFLNGMQEEALARLEDPGLQADQQMFLKSLSGMIDLLKTILSGYADQIRTMKDGGADPAWADPLLESVERILAGPPACFRDALQLVWFYSAMTGGRDFGRMDVYLGDLYVRDIDSGVLREEEAIQLLLFFYQLMKETDSRDGFPSPS